ncbi:hypothetical protein KKA53_05355 [Candidatus Dependentiae bacterium]|nr:hypothetical protein [Candidatus Dependentiae bacterium]
MPEIKQRPQPKDKKTGQFLSMKKGTRLGIKHGAEFYLRSGRLPSVRGRKIIARCLREFERDLRGALGEELTPQMEAMVRQVLRCENVLRLIELYLIRASPMKVKEFERGSLELQPCLSNSYGHFMNVQRLALLALGLDRRSDILALPWEDVEDEGVEKAKGAKP